MSGKAFEPLHGGKIKVTAGQQIVSRLGIVAHGEDLALTAERSAFMQFKNADLDFLRISVVERSVTSSKRFQSFSWKSDD